MGKRKEAEACKSHAAGAASVNPPKTIRTDESSTKTVSQATEPGPVPISLTDISCAKYRLQGGLDVTSLRQSAHLSEATGADVYLKFELHHRTGSFKERGARNRILMLTEEEKRRGVVAASAGNHALAMAFHGKSLGVPVTVCMPKNAPITKISNCQKLGARVILHGDHLQEARVKALEIGENENLIYVNGFDDPYVIAGAGTLGLEILEQLVDRDSIFSLNAVFTNQKDVEAVIIPVGGGGMIAGVTLAIKAIRPEVLVYGVEAENCPSFTKALESGEPVNVKVEASLADGLAVCKVGTNAFAACHKLVDKTVTCTEKEIALAVLKLVEDEKTVTEGAGAIGVAALLAGKFPELKGRKVVIPLCGGNIDPGVLGTVIQRGMASDGRLFRFEASISDRPGGLAAFTKLIADTGASVKDIGHDRTFNLEPSRVVVQVVLETRDRDHAAAVQKHLMEEESIHVRFH